MNHRGGQIERLVVVRPAVLNDVRTMDGASRMEYFEDGCDFIDVVGMDGDQGFTGTEMVGNRPDPFLSPTGNAQRLNGIHGIRSFHRRLLETRTVDLSCLRDGDGAQASDRTRSGSDHTASTDRMG